MANQYRDYWKSELRRLAKLNNWPAEFLEQASAFLDQSGSHRLPDDIDGGVGWSKLAFRWPNLGRELVVDLDDDGNISCRALTLKESDGAEEALKALAAWSKPPRSFASQLAGTINAAAKKNLALLLETVFQTVVNADLALSGAWDRSDAGFQAAKEEAADVLSGLGIDVEAALAVARREFVAEVEAERG